MRNPLNSIASLLLIDGARASWTNMSLIAAVAERYERAGGEYVLSLAQQHGVSAAVMTRSSPNILILKYEAFNGRLEEAMARLQAFVRCKLPASQVSAAIEALSIEAVQSHIASNLNGSGFFTVEAETGWHGHHVSDFAGRTDYRELISEQAVDALMQRPVIAGLMSRFYGGKV